MMPHSGHEDGFTTPATDPDKPHKTVSQFRSHAKGLAAAPLEQAKKLWRPTNTTLMDHTAAGPCLAPLGTLARAS
ncbi:hypothetical protein Taro_030334 [Colocasia esculenta]|uniref:Uncharacterized protein n=1 Tax=Colocasia esculenta TaxID=4460 RepID=A0A843VM71_COLES|nr:hypothetical protein [Colocasia esculenta]